MKLNIVIITLCTIFTAWAFSKGSVNCCGIGLTPRPVASASGTLSGHLAPDWQLQGLNGKTVQLSDFKGKIVVLNFWATWCPPCLREIPELVALQRKYADQGVVVVGVSLDEGGPSAVQSFVKKEGVHFPIVMGDQKTVLAYGGLTSIPNTFIINRDGKFAGSIQGGAGLADFEAAIQPSL